jgi:hypothetical protein
MLARDGFMCWGHMGFNGCVLLRHIPLTANGITGGLDCHRQAPMHAGM